ncbi:hypothetical protein chiPu_0001964 [Chiloscyllium punctatum]|uniref:Uncharacterized protein n=1 Tax=Chiloscyllium punctatum TaxID=137246 RepID=A0A401RZH2_CHIPU|nr:hypothetical protein [Chiloscyllium punctatum]
MWSGLSALRQREVVTSEAAVAGGHDRWSGDKAERTVTQVLQFSIIHEREPATLSWARPSWCIPSLSTTVWSRT